MSPRAKWMAAVAMLILLGAIGVWIDRRASDAPISKARAIELVPTANDAGNGSDH